ncbi:MULTISPECIES: SDR family oxidoreductase [Dyella]|uniref:SDR family oxidoreductase n=2 Tax=Dyella TaxID=231454 RepID=A0A4R0YN56_9GAMM|nr:MULTISPECIES: SDR family oxidoreductase [Dyella]TBR36336.1 SDR family oxidoreductase [Dyella terrae]TCI05993.1 SDR family oxidoreductase [Dyella soli]
MKAFEQQHVLIVGGSSGIGEAAAQAFLAEGAKVAIASRSKDKLDAAAARLQGSVDVAVLDTADVDAVQSFFSGREAFDHVVISAAQTPSGPLRELPLDKARAAMDSKFWGAYHVARAARIAPHGSLTFVSGYLSVRPSPSAVLQGAINAALESLARGLALELSPVRVNTVSPGLIATPLWSGMSDAARDAMFANAAAQLPARRMGQPEDVAHAILYLAATPFATGSTVLVDGGGAIA